MLEWAGHVGPMPRLSRLPLGGEVSFACGADRRCTGVWRAGRRLTCPYGAQITPAARSAQCPSCAALDRSSSIAADTRLDDPRIFAVYLAHHGSAIKVGITAAERGQTRLLEQGALASTVLSVGTLASGRRAENLLSAALGLPDRISTARKRAARADPGNQVGRAADLMAAASHAQQLAWPQGQDRSQPRVRDHVATYGLPDRGLRPDAEVLPLDPGCVVRGTVNCRIGADIYLDTPAGVVLLDTRLLAGWALHRAEPDAAFSARLRTATACTGDHDVLF
jgi:hypothetical protein